MKALVASLKKEPLPPRTAADERWATVTDDTPVVWEGHVCRFGELAGNERMECEWWGDTLVGRFVF